MAELATRREHLEELGELRAEQTLANTEFFIAKIPSAIQYVRGAPKLGEREVTWCRDVVAMADSNVQLAARILDGAATLIRPGGASVTQLRAQAANIRSVLATLELAALTGELNSALRERDAL